MFFTLYYVFTYYFNHIFTTPLLNVVLHYCPFYSSYSSQFHNNAAVMSPTASSLITGVVVVGAGVVVTVVVYQVEVVVGAGLRWRVLGNFWRKRATEAFQVG